jgi:hypothetical protein
MVVAIEASVYESHVVNNPELEWYRLSSVARHPIFQVLLQSDFDFAQDYVRFIDCIKTGAESGRKVAQFFMGIVCLDQAAKESDPARISEALKCAYDYLLNSSAQNYPPANYILERIPSSTDCRNVNVVKLLKEVDTPSVRDVFDSDLMIEPNKGSPNGPPAITSTGRAGGCIII